MPERLFITGNEAAVRGAVDAGAKIMFGYPITPATEILEGWIAKASVDKNLQYLQSEDEMAIHGGNGDSFRIVYSASTVEEMYELVIKAFSSAWKYRFPTFVLGDGYLGKMKSTVTFKKMLKPVESRPILSGSGGSTWLRNCFSKEADLNQLLRHHIADWTKNKRKIAKGVKRIFIIESAYNQLGRIVRSELAGYDIKAKISQISKPAEGFTADEIIAEVKKHNA